MKRCSSKYCQNNNPQELSNFYRDKSNRDGLTNRCKQCCSISAIKTYKKYQKEYDRRKVEYWSDKKEKLNAIRKKAHLKHRYKIDIEQWNQMYENQKGLCKICGVHSSELKISLVVDHCHKTNAIRHLLCTNCNWLIANAKEDVQILKSAISYLQGDS